MKVPVEIMAAFEQAAIGEKFARILLEQTIHDGRSKFRVIKEVSVIPGRPTSGAVHKVAQK